MSAHKETAPTRREGRSQSSNQPDPRLPIRSPRNYKPGCPAGCPPGRHECGAGQPLTELAPPGPFDLAGRDLEMQERDRLGLLWLEQGRAA